MPEITTSAISPRKLSSIRVRERKLEERPKPAITVPTDAIVNITKTTICGTDLLLKGDVPSRQPDRILGHEGVSIVDKIGTAVTAFKPGDRVLISCISACGKCVDCRKLFRRGATGSPYGKNWTRYEHRQGAS